jgi:hypothetical protein
MEQRAEGIVSEKGMRLKAFKGGSGNAEFGSDNSEV